MENEWLDLAYINFDKVIMHGQIVDHTTVEIEQALTQEQKNKVYDLNEKHQREMRALLRSFVKWMTILEGTNPRDGCLTSGNVSAAG